MSSTDETAQEPVATNGDRRSRLGNATFLMALAGLAIVGGAALYRTDPLAHSGATATAASAAAPTALPWIAAAPGRIEPRTGEIRVGTPILGRIADVLVKTNDEVNEGELLVRLDDEDVRARLSAAEAEAGARKRERDAQTATSGRDDVRKAEDAAYTSERLVTAARNELDNLVATIRNGTVKADRFADVRKKLSDARDRLARDRTTLLNALARANLPAPNRFESSLTAGRADVSAADALLEKTRLRAPLGGRILQLHAKIGETVAPAPDQPLVVMGDMSVIRVKAEVDERDVGKLSVGQSAFVRSDAFGTRSFEGKISAVALALGPPRIGQRGPRRPTDVEVLEVTIDLVGESPLLPGMRVDAFFRKAEEPAKPAEPAKSTEPAPPAAK
jgi:HlyD family secretion protein